MDMTSIRGAVKLVPKTIIYNVYLPIVPVLLLADLNLPMTSAGRDFIVGDIIPCSLCFNEVRWLMTMPGSVDVLCEAIIQNDLWMFSGKRRQVLNLTVRYDSLFGPFHQVWLILHILHSRGENQRRCLLI